jgi:hypothetical protein
MPNAYETRMFIVVFTKAHFWFYPVPVKTTFYLNTSFLNDRFNITLSLMS